MKFEYDHAKSRQNLAKHGIDFIEAQKLWQGAVVVFPSRQPGESGGSWPLASWRACFGRPWSLSGELGGFA
jgi:hypothetical protein